MSILAVLIAAVICCVIMLIAIFLAYHAGPREPTRVTAHHGTDPVGVTIPRLDPSNEDEDARLHWIIRNAEGTPVELTPVVYPDPVPVIRTQADFEAETAE